MEAGNAAVGADENNDEYYDAAGIYANASTTAGSAVLMMEMLGTTSTNVGAELVLSTDDGSVAGTDGAIPDTSIGPCACDECQAA